SDLGALVKIVSPCLIPQLEILVDNERCTWVKKEYSLNDIGNAVLIFSCTDLEEVNAEVASDAKDNLRHINVVDDPDKCSFIVPSIMERGDLTIAVSTAGSSPIVARQVRAELETMYGDEMAEYLSLLKSWRADAKKSLPLNKREKFWQKATDGEVLSLIKAKRLNEAEEVIAGCFRSLLE
ncbi:MAG: bifunctional precorrin-2 dehydrogenase/sirohydrochlorin ferrochelatase, partial [Desulfitobacterium hafniense]|nr:bifunctional precorrin-2 dehydrogenase/sirohydrochlorin ferrochelatase [Desulfitobacterium hafniense]